MFESKGAAPPPRLGVRSEHPVESVAQWTLALLTVLAVFTAPPGVVRCVVETARGLSALRPAIGRKAANFAALAVVPLVAQDDAVCGAPAEAA